MGAQDNTYRLQALEDIKDALVAMNVFREISDSPKGPEEVQVFPCAYYFGGEGPREPADVQHVLFRSVVEYSIFLYVHESESKGSIANVPGLAAKLETLIQLTMDKMDACTQGTFRNSGYDMWVSRVDTDGGALRMTGSPIAMAVVVLTANFPPKHSA